ncbi:hypothetical protein PR048_013653 [Dryococelus australis]|uniref:Uncharacterized protein n=1 Tax=Dryococelus australis TaxID=614101 RepID=A0ABQ9HUB6_9NEOP|nr:hypothetical protein PR048_013653 [Dryococelus australis]
MKSADFEAARKTPFIESECMHLLWMQGSPWRLSSDWTRPGGVVARLFAYRQGDTCSIPGWAASGLSHVGIVPDDAPCQRAFSGISRFPRPCIPMLIEKIRINSFLLDMSAKSATRKIRRRRVWKQQSCRRSDCRLSALHRRSGVKCLLDRENSLITQESLRTEQRAAGVVLHGVTCVRS